MFTRTLGFGLSIVAASFMIAEAKDGLGLSLYANNTDEVPNQLRAGLDSVITEGQKGKSGEGVVATWEWSQVEVENARPSRPAGRCQIDFVRSHVPADVPNSVPYIKSIDWPVNLSIKSLKVWWPTGHEFKSLGVGKTLDPPAEDSIKFVDETGTALKGVQVKVYYMSSRREEHYTSGEDGVVKMDKSNLNKYTWMTVEFGDRLRLSLASNVHWTKGVIVVKPKFS